MQWENGSLLRWSVCLCGSQSVCLFHLQSVPFPPSLPVPPLYRSICELQSVIKAYRVSWVCVLTVCSVISAGLQLCFSVPDWSPEVFGLAWLSVWSGCFWNTGLTCVGAKRITLFSRLCSTILPMALLPGCSHTARRYITLHSIVLFISFLYWLSMSLW